MTDLFNPHDGPLTFDMRGVPFQTPAARNAARPDNDYRSAWKAYLTPTEPPAPTPLAQLVRHHRQRLGLSQLALSHTLGRSHAYVAQIELGTNCWPAYETMAKLATVFSITPFEVVSAAVKSKDLEVYEAVPDVA